jgi:HEAT repeats
MRIRHDLLLVVSGVVLYAVGCGGPSTAKLIGQLADSDAKIRCAAARELGMQTGDVSEAVTALAGATKDTDLAVREAAVAALGHLGPAAKPSEPALELALRDPELSVRLGAAFALAKIDPQTQDIQPVILDSLNAGHGTVFLDVGQMGSDAKWAIPTLVKLLGHQRAGIRALAARTLGQIGVKSSEADAGLIRSLRDSDAAVRNAAKQALDKMG